MNESKIDEFVRDLTSIVPLPKSYVRRRLNEVVDAAVNREKQAWLYGLRCHCCGKAKEPDGLSDWCRDCFENA